MLKRMIILVVREWRLMFFRRCFGETKLDCSGLHGSRWTNQKEENCESQKRGEGVSKANIKMTNRWHVKKKELHLKKIEFIKSLAQPLHPAWDVRKTLIVTHSASCTQEHTWSHTHICVLTDLSSEYRVTKCWQLRQARKSWRNYWKCHRNTADWKIWAEKELLLIKRKCGFN